jgi:hypothetical protein
MPLVDCNTLVGAWPQAEVELSVEALAAGMQSRQVGTSLITHTAAIFYNPAAGNDQARALAAQHQPLRPVAVLNPLEYPTCLAEAERQLAAGVQVFRLCPKEHGYPLSGAFGPLREVFEALSAARLVLIDAADLANPVLSHDVADLLRCATAVTVDERNLGTAVQCGRRTPHLLVETSRLEAGGALEAAVAHLGAARVLFGSAQPLRSIGSAVMSVQFAELSDADRAAIFEGNAQRLLA